jgi:hypothetical protein
VRGWEWAYEEPPALVPVPAADLRPLTGRRVIVHLGDDRSWNHDFVAASEPHEYRGATHVGIVPRPVPITQLWVETRVEVTTDDAPVDAPVDQSHVPQNAGPARRIVDATQPPVQRLRRGLFETTVHGRRAAITSKFRPRWPYRVCSEPYLGELPDVIEMRGGLDDIDKPVIGPVVNVCSEASWQIWTSTGEQPDTIIPKALYRVWVV